MTQCLTKPMRTTINNHAFSMVELMLAVGFSVLLLTGVYGFFNAASQSYFAGIAGENLQDAANIVLSQITQGITESTGVYRVSTAVSFMIPNGTTNYWYTCIGGNPQATSCNTSQPNSELYFCQDNSCAQSGGVNESTARWYYLNSTGNAVIYHHPKTGGGYVEQTIYTAPTGTSLTLRFTPAQQPNPSPPPATIAIPNVIEIDVALTRNSLGGITNQRLVFSGSASTFVLLRGHQ